MDERRVLVDREELRRSLDDERINRQPLSQRAGLTAALAALDAMPAVECPRGWTRDEVLAELDADPDAVCEQQSVQMAEWFTVPTGAIGSWHPEVRRYDVRVVRVAPEPEWVPLTQLVGRTIHGRKWPVRWRTVYGDGRDMWSPDTRDNWHFFPEGTLNLETGQVAVRPKAAT